jgi:beta-glucosidase
MLNLWQMRSLPGYNKDLYMPEGLHYAYKDSDGNIYKMDHRLTY